MPIDALEVVLLAAGARDLQAKFDEDGEAGEGEDAAEDPKEKGYAD